MATYRLGHVAGNKWYYGTLVYRDGEGNVVTGEGVFPKLYHKDFYINTDTGDYFQCSVDSETNEVSWSYVGTMKGNQGVQGETGSQGPQGPRGQMYIPHVNANGDLSWTVGDGANVETTNIRGPAFHFDAMGSLSEKPATASAGYAYLVTSGVDGGGIDRAGWIYVMEDSGWSEPFQFRGDRGDRGAVFTPSIDSDGIISWSNDGNLQNPEAVSIRGPQGVQGVSIEAVVQDTVNSVPGGENVVSVVMTDGTSSTFSVYNGVKGDTGVSISAVAVDENKVDDRGVNTVTILLTDGTSSSFEIQNGSKGDKGTTWHVGEAMSGNHSHVPFSVSNESLATSNLRVEDFYLNTESDEYYRCLNIEDGVFSSWVYVGTMRGKNGEMGAIFTTGTAGLYEDLNLHINEPEGFCYYAYDVGLICVRTAETENADLAWDERQIRGEKGEDGETGAVFIPQITSGVLSWNNNGGYTNPSPLDLRKAGANLVCSPTPPEKPYNGMIWVRTRNDTKYMNIDGLNVVTGSEEPVAPKNGDIWIRD